MNNTTQAARRLQRAQTLFNRLPETIQKRTLNSIGKLENITEGQLLYSAAVVTELNEDKTGLKFFMTEGHIPKVDEDLILLAATRTFSDCVAGTVSI